MGITLPTSMVVVIIKCRSPKHIKVFISSTLFISAPPFSKKTLSIRFARKEKRSLLGK